MTPINEIAIPGMVVTIRNRATLVLFQYAPYRPNQVALGAERYGLMRGGCYRPYEVGNIYWTKNTGAWEK